MISFKNILFAGMVCCGAAAATSCQENEFGTVDLSMPEEDDSYVAVNYTYDYSNIAGLYSDADFASVKQSLDDGTAPQAVKDEFQNLKASKYSQLTYMPDPQDEIVRGDATGTATGKENYAYAMRDAAAAYQMALLWKLTGNDQYADKVVEILNAWAAKCKKITSNDANQVLAAGAQGYTFATAANIVKGYNGWSAAKQEQFKQWMLTVFATKNGDFLKTHTGSNVCAEHYWSNWDLVNMCSYMAIGIFAEDNDMVNYVVNYFYQGVGNGCIKRLIRGTHQDPLGTGEIICQNQESGRDQGHSEMSMVVTANLAQMAWTLYQQNPACKELDFFSANDNAILKMGEYVALFNLRNGSDNANKTGQWLVTAQQMPFTKFEYCQPGCGCKNTSHGAIHTQAADDEGRGNVRPGWEILVAHYGANNGNIKYVKQMADKILPEGGAGEALNRYGDNSGAFDQLGWSTIMLYK